MNEELYPDEFNVDDDPKLSSVPRRGAWGAGREGVSEVEVRLNAIRGDGSLMAFPA